MVIQGLRKFKATKVSARLFLDDPKAPGRYKFTVAPSKSML